MHSTFKILFYINKNKIKADDTTAILCRITIDGANVEITTGENTAPHDWSVKRGETTDKKKPIDACKPFGKKSNRGTIPCSTNMER